MMETQDSLGTEARVGGGGDGRGIGEGKVKQGTVTGKGRGMHRNGIQWIGIEYRREAEVMEGREEEGKEMHTNGIQ